MLLQTLVAFAAVAVLGAILRLFFGRGRDTAQIAWPSTGPEDFGLLAPAAVVDSKDDAETLRAILADAGIKATTNIAPDGRYRILVFRSELDRARHLSGPA